MPVSCYKLLLRFLEVQSFLSEQSASTIFVWMFACGSYYPVYVMGEKKCYVRCFVEGPKGAG